MLDYAEMTLKTIGFKKAGVRAIVTLNRPDVLNCINDQMLDELEFIFTRCDRDKEVTIIVLKSAGSESFCSGIDVACVKVKVAHNGH